MRVNEVTFKPSLSKIGNALRFWTSNAIYRSSAGERIRKIKAAMLLSKVKNQQIPKFAFRAFGINTKNVQDWGKFIDRLDSTYPESYSASLPGVKDFLRNSGVDYTAVVIGISIAPSNFMFDVRSIAKQLSSKELSIEDDAGFSIKEYLPQHEVVLKPGSLKNSFSNGSAFLIGYAVSNRRYGTSMVWLSKPQLIKADSIFPKNLFKTST